MYIAPVWIVTSSAETRLQSSEATAMRAVVISDDDFPWVTRLQRQMWDEDAHFCTHRFYCFMTMLYISTSASVNIHGYS